MKKRILILIFAVLLCGGCTKETTAPSEVPTPSATETVTQAATEMPTKIPIDGLSNELCGWGFRRLGFGRPEFTATQETDMENFHCIYMGEETEKRLYLTFDEGYENGYTEKILDTLKKTNTPAAFFITGAYLEREEELVGRMVEEGHIVGNHSLNHPSMPSLLREADIEKEISSLEKNFYDTFGAHMTYFRPPRGEYSARTLAITKNLGYTSVFWSLAYEDWHQDRVQGADYAYSQVMKNLHPGCVLLLHAVSKDNADALERIITDARSEGYEFYSLDDYQ